MVISKSASLLLFIVSIGMLLTPVASIPINTYVECQVSDEALFIYGNSDFTYHGFPGSGTESDPYVIENLIIIGPLICLAIENTDAYYIVRNCVFTSAIDIRYASYGAVSITDSNNSKFENCLISGGDNGFTLTDSFNVNLTGCNFTDNVNSDIAIRESGEYDIENCSLEKGMDIVYRGTDQLDISVNNTLISDKELFIASHETDMQYNGTNCRQMILLFCENITIRDFTEHNFSFPIIVVGSVNCTLESLHLMNDTHPPILVSYSESTNFVNCSFSKRGISFSGNVLDHWLHNYEDVTVAERQFGYFESLENVCLSNDNYGQYILIDCYNPKRIY